VVRLVREKPHPSRRKGRDRLSLREAGSPYGLRPAPSLGDRGGKNLAVSDPSTPGCAGQVSRQPRRREPPRGQGGEGLEAWDLGPGTAVDGIILHL